MVDEEENPIELAKIETKEAYLEAQANYIAENSTRFTLETGLELVLRIVSGPVWSYILASNNITAMSMTAEELKAAKLDNMHSVKMRVKEQMDANQTGIINALIKRAAVDVPEWFDATLMDQEEASAFIESYATEMLRRAGVDPESGEPAPDDVVETFRPDGVAEDVGGVEQEPAGDDPEPVSEGLLE